MHLEKEPCGEEKQQVHSLWAGLVPCGEHGAGVARSTETLEVTGSCRTLSVLARTPVFTPDLGSCCRALSVSGGEAWICVLTAFPGLPGRSWSRGRCGVRGTETGR